jgi:hypothetical protein
MPGSGGAAASGVLREFVAESEEVEEIEALGPAPGPAPLSR